MLSFMKTLFTFLFATLILLGCKKDDDVAPGNSFSFNGQNFEISQAILFDRGLVGTGLGHWMELFVLSSGIKVHDASGDYDSTSGNGQFLYFEIFSPSGGALAEGSYVFDPRGTYKSNTFDFSIAIFNSNLSKAAKESSEITAGKVTVTKQGTDYRIIFDCAIADGTRISGTYKGPLKYYSQL